MPNLKDKYLNEVVPALKEKFGLTNPMTVPKITKVVLNMAFGILDKDAQNEELENVDVENEEVEDNEDNE